MSYMVRFYELDDEVINRLKSDERAYNLNVQMAAGFIIGTIERNGPLALEEIKEIAVETNAFKPSFFDSLNIAWQILLDMDLLALI